MEAYEASLQGAHGSDGKILRGTMPRACQSGRRSLPKDDPRVLSGLPVTYQSQAWQPEFCWALITM